MVLQVFFLFVLFFTFFFNDTATTEIYTLSLHDALPISEGEADAVVADFDAHLAVGGVHADVDDKMRSEEHTSELQSLTNLVCRLLLEKKKKKNKRENSTKICINNTNTIK